MDTTVMIVVIGAVMLGVVVFMLNRAWGNFPSRPSLPPASSPAHPEQPSAWDQRQEVDEWRHTEQSEPPDFLGGREAELVPLDQPLVKKAVLHALQTQHPSARYFVQHGDRVYVALSRIEDPALRQRAGDLFRRLNSGAHFDPREMLALIRDLFSR